MLTIYTKDGCDYCDVAKSHLKKHNIVYEEVNVGIDKQAKEFVLSQGHKTVPQIYYHNELFVSGGAEELKLLSKEEIQSRMEKINGKNKTKHSV